MKKIALFMAMAIAALACTPEEQIVPELKVTSTAESLVIPTAGSEEEPLEITFETNVDWTATVDAASADWCSITPSSGTKDAAVIKVIALENKNNDNRVATITINAQTEKAEVKVTQLQKNALVLAGDKTFKVSCDGGEVKFAVNANVELSAEVDADWITAAGTKAMETTEYVFNVAVNRGEERTGKITVSSGDLKEEVTVIQDAFVPVFEVSPAEAQSVPAEGGNIEYTINTNLEYAVAVDCGEGVEAWLEQVESKADPVESKIVFTASGHDLLQTRSATITFTTEYLDPVVLTVNQAAAGARFEVSPAADQWLDVYGGSVEITVDANIEYNFVVAENDWLTVTENNGVFTLAAAENESFDYRSIAVNVTPKDEAYAEKAVAFYVFQNGRANKLWTLNPTLDLEGYDASKKVRLAKYGDYILVANTTKAYALNPADGSVVTTFNFPEGMEAPSFCVDDAGNIVVATDCGYGGVMGIYSIADPTNPQPELIKDWDTGHYYGNDVGNLRVKGNIKENAVMTALVGGGAGGAVMMWKFENGVCSTWYGVNPPYETAAGCTCACAAPLGTKFEDGLLHVGYGGDYNVKYLANPVLDNYTDNAWVTSYVTGYSWMENTNCITTAEYNGKKYAAYTAGCHFNYDSADAILLDITDPAAAKHVYTYNGDLDVARDEAFANLNWTGLGTYSDILLVPTADALLMVYVDSNFNGMSCIAIK